MTGRIVIEVSAEGEEMRTTVDAELKHVDPIGRLMLICKICRCLEMEQKELLLLPLAWELNEKTATETTLIRKGDVMRAMEEE